MNTKSISQPWRSRIKRARRKLNRACSGVERASTVPARRELVRAETAWKRHGEVKTPKVEV